MSLRLKSVYRFALMFLAAVLFLLFSSWLVVEMPISTVYAQTPPLKIEQTAIVDYTDSGPHITYETLIANEGTAPLRGVLITDVLPAQASLLYFSHSEGTKWLSTQRATAEGQLVLWLNQGPFDPGATARLTYVVEVPWGDVKSTELKKDLPVARAEDLGEITYQGEVGVAFDQTPPPSPTPTITSFPQPSATPSPTRESTNTPVMQAESPTTVIRMPEPSPTSTLLESPAAPALTPSPMPTPEEAEGTFPVVPVVVIIILIILAIIVWLLTKKR